MSDTAGPGLGGLASATIPLTAGGANPDLRRRARRGVRTGRRHWRVQRRRHELGSERRGWRLGYPYWRSCLDRQDPGSRRRRRGRQLLGCRPADTGAWRRRKWTIGIIRLRHRRRRRNPERRGQCWERCDARDLRCRRYALNQLRRRGRRRRLVWRWGRSRRNRRRRRIRSRPLRHSLQTGVRTGDGLVRVTYPGRSLDVSVSGSGGGYVDSSPIGIDCSAGGTGGHSTCSNYFPDGSQVTLQAHPTSNADFAGFSGGGCQGRRAPVRSRWTKPDRSPRRSRSSSAIST